MLKRRIALIAAIAMSPAAAAQWTSTSTGVAELRGLGAASDQVVWASGARGLGRWPAWTHRALDAIA